MRSKTNLVLLLVIVLLVLLSTPVASQSWNGETNIAVGSNHSVESDFQSGQLDSLIIQNDRITFETDEFSSDVTRPADNNNPLSSNARGLVVEPKNDVYNLEVRLSNNLGSDSGKYIQVVDSSNDNVLERNSIDDAKESGDWVALETELSEGNRYIIEIDRDGLDYTAGVYSDPVFPYESDYIDIVNGSIDSAETDMSVGNIDSVRVDTEDNLESGEYQSDTHAVTDPTEGYVDLELENTNAEIDWQANDGTGWTTVQTQSTSQSGELTADLSAESAEEYRVIVNLEKQSGAQSWDASINEDGVRFENTAPTISNLDPDDEEILTDDPIRLEADISDPDFDTVQGDSVDIIFYDGSDQELGSQTITSDSTVGIDHPSPFAGTNEWYIVAEDDYGATTQTDVRSFSAPANLEIRDVNTQDQIQNANVTVEFFTGEIVVEKEVTDGTVDMSGVPLEENLIVVVTAEGYLSRTTIVPSILEQQTVWMLDEKQDSVLNEFQLDDNTGNFQIGESRVLIKRPIEDDDGDRTFQIVSGDYFGADGVFAAELQRGQRYQLAILNDDGVQRSVGTYTPQSPGLRTIEIGAASWTIADDENYATNLELQTDEEGAQTIIFEFGDPADRASNLNLRVEERFNDSNVIYEETGADPSDYRLVLPLEKSQENTQWAINYSVTVDGEQRTGYLPIGGDHSVPLPIDSEWLQVFVVVAIVMVAAAFPGSLSAIGGFAIVSVAGVAMILGWLSIPIIAWFVAATIAVLGIVRSSNGDLI